MHYFLKESQEVENFHALINIQCQNEDDVLDIVIVTQEELDNEDFEIKNGDRIAQLVFAKHESVDLEVIDSLEKSARGESGFGSTGIK